MQTRAFTAKPNTDGDSNAVESDLDSFKQWQLDNGNFLVIGTGKDLDSKLPGSSGVEKADPSWSTTSPFDTHDEVAKHAAQAEAALGKHSFGSYTLDYSQVFEHDELDVKAGEPYNANNQAVKKDSNNYRETTKSSYGRKWSFHVADEYTGDIKFTFDLKSVQGGDVYAHARLVELDSQGNVVEEVNHWNTSQTSYQSHEEVLTFTEDEAPEYEFQMKVTQPLGASNHTARAQGLTAAPKFKHDGEEFWLDEVSREPLPTTEFKNRVGL